MNSPIKSPCEKPIALTIAGSDSGGGAGIQADLKTFAALGVHGTSAITCITAQNPDGVRGVQPVKPELVQQQLEAIDLAFQPAGVKTGMLYSDSIIRTVAEFYDGRPRNLVIDPVMVATSGAMLLKKSAVRSLKILFGQAVVITPNLPEAAAILGRELHTDEDLRSAAREIYEHYGCAALVKGGHLPGAKEAVDFFFDGYHDMLLQAPYLHGIKTHGTGCTYSAAIAAGLAKGENLILAVESGKEYVSQAIAQSFLANGFPVLNSFWR